MCQRYSFIHSAKAVESLFGHQLKIPVLRSSYNICPTQRAPVITNEFRDKVQHLHWGLVPEWSKGINKGHLINAREETISTAASFRMPVREKRCLVLADSFYAWKQSGTQSLPYRLFDEGGGILIFAGVWAIWQQHDRVIKSFSIITKAATGGLNKITNRIPVVLGDPGIWEKWLDDIPFNTVLEILKNTKSQKLRYHQIPDRINSLRYDEPDLHDEVLDPQPEF